MQKMHYSHNNPVRAGLFERAEHYRWSSVRCWNKNRKAEPLLMNISDIKWKEPEGVAFSSRNVFGKAEPFRTGCGTAALNSR